MRTTPCLVAVLLPSLVGDVLAQEPDPFVGYVGIVKTMTDGKVTMELVAIGE